MGAEAEVQWIEGVDIHVFFNRSGTLYVSLA